MSKMTESENGVYLHKLFWAMKHLHSVRNYHYRFKLSSQETQENLANAEKMLDILYRNFTSKMRCMK